MRETLNRGRWNACKGKVAQLLRVWATQKTARPTDWIAASLVAFA
jgi:hypothetical protein